MSRGRVVLAGMFCAAACRGVTPDAAPSPIATMNPGAPTSAAAASGSASGASAPASSSPSQIELDGEPMDVWTRDDGRLLPQVTWLRSAAEGEPALPPRCAALERRFGKRKDVIDFGCALSPTGEVWAAVATLKLPPDPRTQVVAGRWFVVVEQQGVVAQGKAVEFKLFASHAGGACKSDPAPCLQYAHYQGLLWPRGFRFLQLNAGKPAVAVAATGEEINSDRAQEFALTAWHLGSAGVELHELSRASTILGITDCDGDKKPEMAVNPYRTAGDEFLLHFGAHARASSEAWSLLLTLEKGGKTNDGPLSKRYARRLCPEPVDKPFAGDPRRWPQALHCSKLWCAPEANLLQELEAACKTPAVEGVATACTTNRSALERMARTNIPCLLPQAAELPLPAGCFDQVMAETLPEP